MPLLNGEVISTLRDANGATIIAVVFFYDRTTRLLRDSTYTTVQDGTKTGALIADNVTASPIRVAIANDQNGNPRRVTVPPHGVALTVAQLASQGITTLDDVNGLTFDLA
jgi:hypothetical protein